MAVTLPYTACNCVITRWPFSPSPSISLTSGAAGPHALPELASCQNGISRVEMFNYKVNCYYRSRRTANVGGMVLLAVMHVYSSTSQM